jgi:drug/metabolite transporter (DMT)-like permease
MSASPSPRLSISGADWLLILTLSLLWGATFPFAKIAVPEIPPLTLTLGRVTFAALALAPFAWAMTRTSFGAREWLSFAVMGLINTSLPGTLVYWGQMHIPAGLASILNATTPLFSVVVAHFATSDDKLTPSRLAGLAVGFLGVVVMIGPDLLKEIGANVAAQLACLTAALCYALAAVYARSRFRGRPPLVFAAGQLSASVPMMLPIALLVDRPWTLSLPSVWAVGSMLAIALLSTALAYVIYFRLIARTGATNALLVTFLVPVSAILLATLLLGERLEPRHFMGMAAIMAGLAAIDGRPARFLARATRARRRRISPDRV